ncbi:MAG: hypothetical protein J7L96_10185 [Bacteroidales bacterium]|nr:hypothetical protein [Bacteroidales bacterium]
MSKENKFKYKSGEMLRSHAQELNLKLPWSTDIDVLFTPWSFGGVECGNRFVIHPMEGFDAHSNGSPAELSFRRYKRFSKGGNGLVWVEATSVTADGRSNPAQLFINEKSLDGFKKVVELCKTNAALPGESQKEVKTNIQLTHSGRYSKPYGKPQPQVVTLADGTPTALPEAKMLSDDDLKRIRDAHVEAAYLAYKVGFDAVDIKACHGYLLHELLFARHRENSIYGGSAPENRFRLMREIIEGIRQTVSQLAITARINVFDGLDKGFGVGKSNGEADLSEVKMLMNTMDAEGVSLWSITAGIPYINPWIGRPFDKPTKIDELAPEHPLIGVVRMINLCNEASEFTDRPVIGAGLSWLRQYLPYVAAGIVKDKLASAIGVGRMGIAYPDLPADLFNKRLAEKNKVCTACSKCTKLMRQGLPAGCAVRDKEVYVYTKNKNTK